MRKFEKRSWTRNPLSSVEEKSLSRLSSKCNQFMPRVISNFCNRFLSVPMKSESNIFVHKLKSIFRSGSLIYQSINLKLDRFRLLITSIMSANFQASTLKCLGGDVEEKRNELPPLARLNILAPSLGRSQNY